MAYLQQVAAKKEKIVLSHLFPRVRSKNGYSHKQLTTTQNIVGFMNVIDIIR